MPITLQTEHDWTVHSINIHGLIFERWCQQAVAEAEGWNLDAAPTEASAAGRSRRPTRQSSRLAASKFRHGGAGCLPLMRSSSSTRDRSTVIASPIMPYGPIMAPACNR